jgi:hypothetical protein
VKIEISRGDHWWGAHGPFKQFGYLPITAGSSLGAVLRHIPSDLVERLCEDDRLLFSLFVWLTLTWPYPAEFSSIDTEECARFSSCLRALITTAAMERDGKVEVGYWPAELFSMQEFETFLRSVRPTDLGRAYYDELIAKHQSANACKPQPTNDPGEERQRQNEESSL